MRRVISLVDQALSACCTFLMALQACPSMSAQPYDCSTSRVTCSQFPAPSWTTMAFNLKVSAAEIYWPKALSCIHYISQQRGTIEAMPAMAIWYALCNDGKHSIPLPFPYSHTHRESLWWTYCMRVFYCYEWSSLSQHCGPGQWSVMTFSDPDSLLSPMVEQE